MNVKRVYDDGLCMQCGTCAAMCPHDAVELTWDLRVGYRLSVREERCTHCGVCLAVCPGPGLDFTAGAWWRERNAGARAQDFLGPWRQLWFGWAGDPRVRHEGASGGAATAILAGALETGQADAVVAAGLDPGNPLEAVGVVCRTPGEVRACRGSKYNVVAQNLRLRDVLDQPGRYVVAGLPCHIQGLRLAQRRSGRLRKRVVATLGIFCGLTNEPRATEYAARRAGLDPGDLADVSYRGPGWPGHLRLQTRDGAVRTRPYPDYFEPAMWALMPPRCRICPDTLAELADVSVGDAWLDRFEGSDGVNDVIARTPAGERLLAALAGRLVLEPAGPVEMAESQAGSYPSTREVGRGRHWLRALAGHPVPQYPGVDLAPSPRERVWGLAEAARERYHRARVDRDYPVRSD
jgi:coenzyme F420 hydrogenase subunit beta